jgi:SM-20-related protein
MSYSEKQWLEWMDLLSEDDYLIIDDFISDELYEKIMLFFNEAEEADHLRKAGIGSMDEFQVDRSIRGDVIYWLDKERDQKLESFFCLMDELMLALRRYCFFSLSGSEFHIAKYPAGTHYERHLDQFSERSNRQITVLIYLNRNWKDGDGGELKMYVENETYLVKPVAKRLLLFKSGSIEHEVLKTNVPRYSLTGWLLHQPSGLGYLF